MKKSKKKTPNADNTLPYYYPTEQVNIAKKMTTKGEERKISERGRSIRNGFPKSTDYNKR